MSDLMDIDCNQIFDRLDCDVTRRKYIILGSNESLHQSPVLHSNYRIRLDHAEFYTGLSLPFKTHRFITTRQEKHIMIG